MTISRRGLAGGAMLLPAAMIGTAQAQTTGGTETTFERVNRTNDIVNVGDAVKVKVLGFDDRGKVKLSMRVVDQATGADITEQVGARRPRAEGEGDDRGDRGPRRDRGDRGPRRERSDAAE